MKNNEKIRIDEDLFSLEYNDVSVYYENDSIKVLKVNNLDKYSLFNIEPESIFIYKKNKQDEINKLSFKINKKDYKTLLDEIYSNHSSPNIFVNFKDSIDTTSETMSWKQFEKNNIPFSKTKIDRYDVLIWKLESCEFLINNIKEDKKKFEILKRKRADID